MASKAKKRGEDADFRSPEEAAADLEIEQYLARNREAIGVKLQKARASIARGKARPLEPLGDLLREARRRAKGAA